MVGETRIIAFGTGNATPEGAEEIPLVEEVVEQQPETAETFEEEAAPPRARGAIVFPALALIAVIAWTAFFLWVKQGEFAAFSAPSAWPRWIADWSLPVLLVGMIWLIAMRHSRREAARFTDAARALSDESARLEARLITVNRELSLAREFMASQARDLDALGRVAVERISQNSDRLQTLIHDNGARVDAIGHVSATALDNMEKLRGQLPVIASSAKDVTNNIGNAGRMASSQLAELASGFQRLNSFGEASERQVESLRGRIDGALGEFGRQCEQLEEIVGKRFAALTERGEEFRAQLDGHEVEALAGIRHRASALAEEVAETRARLDAQEQESLTSLRARLTSLRDEGGALSRAIREGETRSLDSWREAVGRMQEDLQTALTTLESAEERALANARTRLEALGRDIGSLDGDLADRGARFDADRQQRLAEFEAGSEASLSRLSERLGALDAEIAERRTGHERQSLAIEEHSQAIAARLGTFEQHLSGIAIRTGEAETSFTASLQRLADRLDEGRSTLAGTEGEVSRLTDASVRLLEILQASKQHTQHDLQEALGISEGRLAGFESRVTALREAVTDAGVHGERLSGLIHTTHSELQALFGEIEERQARLGRNNEAQGEALAGLRQTLAEVSGESAQLAEKAQGELSQAIEQLLAAARETATAINDTGSRSVAALASQLGEQSASAIDKAMRASAAEAAGQLEQAAAHAAGVSREAAIQLRDQLAKVNELVGNLERRVAHARQRAEEQVDNDFARRAALITESLNSNAIDISKALATDVSDTAWSAYLRGDRGIFTRRAVRLLDASEARPISQVFEQDPDFREHVSRYIHDFEAILRQILSTRDGHALGITLLSSDMGKLYVALAQAIERLRR
jgi:hypothetical protein